MIFNLTNATFSGPVTQGENFTQYVNYNTMTSTTSRNQLFAAVFANLTSTLGTTILKHVGRFYNLPVRNLEDPPSILQELEYRGKFTPERTEELYNILVQFGYGQNFGVLKLADYISAYPDVYRNNDNVVIQNRITGATNVAGRNNNINIITQVPTSEPFGTFSTWQGTMTDLLNQPNNIREFIHQWNKIRGTQKLHDVYKNASELLGYFLCRPLLHPMFARIILTMGLAPEGLEGSRFRAWLSRLRNVLEKEEDDDESSRRTPEPPEPATCLDMLELAEEPLPHPNYLVIGLEQDRLQVKITPKEIQTNEMAQKYLAVAEKSRTSPSCRYATYTFTATVSADGGDKELEFVQDAEMQGGDDDDKGEDGDTSASKKERRVVIKAGVSQSSASKGTTKKFKVGGVEHKITTGKSLPQWLILKRNRPLFYEPVEGEEDLVDEADAHATMKLLKSIHNNWDLAVYVRVLSTKNPISPDMNIISGAKVEILKSPSPAAGGKK